MGARIARGHAGGAGMSDLLYIAIGLVGLLGCWLSRGLGRDE